MSTLRRTIPSDTIGDGLLADEQKYREKEFVRTTTKTTVPVKSTIAARSQHQHSPSTPSKHNDKITWRPHTWSGLLTRILVISFFAFLFHVCYTGWKLTRIIILPDEYLPVWLNVNITSTTENEIWSHTILPTQQASVEGEATPESCMIKLGPVVGKTTDTTTRILLEISTNMTFRLDLIDVQTREIHTRTRQVHSHRPAMFAFDNLQPMTRYHIVAHTPCMTGYLYKYGDGSQSLGSFRTLPPKGFTLTHPSRFAIISCHDIAAVQNRVYFVDVSDPGSEKYQRNRENDLWWHMARLAQKGSLDYLLHVGDQVYADTEEHIEWESRDHLYPPVHPRPWVNSSYVGQLAYPPTYWSAIEVIKGSDPRDWAANSTTVLELYRSVYRVTWGHPPLQYLLSHVPSLMTFDDHEVRDDWGDRPDDSDGHSMEYFVGRMAHRAIIEYQTQLHRDVELWLDAEESRHLDAHHTRKHHTEVDPNPYDEALRGMHHFHVMGQIGVMMVDTRGGRSYYNGHDRNNTGNLYLGEHQWRDIDMALSPEGLFINTTILIVAIPTPIVVLSTRAIDILGWGYDDCWGFWSARPYEADQVRFLQALYEWKHLPVAPGQKPRELIIVSGDIHEGGYTDISFRDETFVTQVVASSIGNTPMPLGGLVTIIVANSISSGVGDTLTAKHDDANVMRRIMSHHPSDFHYNHLNFIRPRNYAILDIWGERQLSTLSVAAKLSNLTAEAPNIHIYHVMAPQKEGVPPVVVVPKLDFDWER